MILGLAIAVGVVLLTFIVLSLLGSSDPPPFTFKQLGLPLTPEQRSEVEHHARIVEAAMSERIRYQMGELEREVATLVDLVPEGEELVIVYDHSPGAPRRASVGMRRVGT